MDNFDCTPRGPVKPGRPDSPIFVAGCEYCGSVNGGDTLGNCAACGAPRSGCSEYEWLCDQKRAIDTIIFSEVIAGAVTPRFIEQPDGSIVPYDPD